MSRVAGRSGALWGVVFGVFIVVQTQGYTSTYKTQALRDQLPHAYGTNAGLNALLGLPHAMNTVAGWAGGLSASSDPSAVSGGCSYQLDLCAARRKQGDTNSSCPAGRRACEEVARRSPVSESDSWHCSHSVAAGAGGTTDGLLARAARTAFMSGNHVSLAVGALVAAGGAFSRAGPPATAARQGAA
jgi:hypothetical protein